MLGIVLTALATLASESGNAIGKYSMALTKDRAYAVGFVSNIGGGILILLSGLLLPANFFGTGVPGGFVFSLASLPFFVPRIGLELLQAHTTLVALARADRSTFSFIRILTLPLLLLADSMLGYPIKSFQQIGIVIVVLGLVLLYANHGINKKGSLITLFTAVNAAVTISLYKYDITHFNSVAAEQSIIIGCIVLYFFVLSFVIAKQNPLYLLRNKNFFAMFTTQALGSLLMSFAYLFAAASVLTAASRALGILWAIATGKWYFQEKEMLLKLGYFILISTGIIFLTL